MDDLLALLLRRRTRTAGDVFKDTCAVVILVRVVAIALGVAAGSVRWGFAL